MQEENNTAGIWKGLNSLINGSNHTRDIPHDLTAEMFNNHFLSVPQNLISHFQTTNDLNLDKISSFCDAKVAPDNCFVVPPMTVLDVGKHISKLKNKKSSGLDGLNANTLQLSLPFTVETLTYIYNLCIDANIFPSALKKAKTIPLPKTSDLSDPNNYRPISILSTLSKPLEKHIHQHLQDYLEDNCLLHRFQSGFRPHHSCKTAVTHITNKWLLEINKSNMTGVIFMDLKKAFDLIDHNILLKKLKIYFRNESTVLLFKSYLERRTQMVYLNGNFSSEGTIKFGVPQGSILGPVLFSLFINDMPLHISDENTTCEMFADDSTLHFSSRTVAEISNSLQSSLNDVNEWCVSNNMVLNPAKTETMLIATRQKLQLNVPSLDISLNGTPIKQVDEHELLGVTIDSQLQWQPHIEQICKIISRKLYLLSRIRFIVDEPTRKIFFHAHIKPHFDYCSNVWDGCSENIF